MNPRRLPDLPPPEFIARDRWYTLLPRRSVGKIVALLLLLAAVIYFRGRAGALVRFFGTVAPAPSGSTSTTSSAQGPPRLRLQMPPASGPPQHSAPRGAGASGAAGRSVPSSSP